MILLSLALLQAPARDPHAVQPERPSVATHAHTVAPGWLEAESGFELDHDGAGAKTVVVPSTIKLGVASHVQLTIQAPLTAPPAVALGAGDITLGAKWRLMDNATILGDFALLPAITLPTGATRTICPVAPPCFEQAIRGAGTTDLSLTVISSHAFGPVTLDLNAQYTHRSGDGTAIPTDATMWAVSWGGSLTDRVGWAFEVHGYPATSGPAGQANIVGLLAGPTFSITTWLAADLGGSLPLTGPTAKTFYLGGTCNIGRLW